MGQIRQSFPGGFSRFKKLLFATTAKAPLDLQDYQTSLKLESARMQHGVIARQIGEDSEGPIPAQFTRGLIEQGGPSATRRPPKRFSGRSASRLIA